MANRRDFFTGVELGKCSEEPHYYYAGRRVCRKTYEFLCLPHKKAQPLAGPSEAKSHST
jgi:hypothetical protein